MKTELKVFNDLQAQITSFVAPSLTIKVVDFKTSAQAVDVAKQIKALQKQIEAKRKEIVEPLNHEVKAVNSFVKDISLPLDRAEDHVQRELSLFATAQEKIRQASLRAAEKARQEAIAVAEAARKRVDEELNSKANDHKSAMAEAEAIFGTDPEEPSFEDRLAVEQDRIRTELDMRAAVASQEHQQRVWDIKQQQVKGTTKRWKCELVDIALVPKEFLITTLNEALVVAAARAGKTEIPGVKLWQDISVAIGRNTYVPKEALE